MDKTIVMCPPYYYDVTYELKTNRWMSLDNRPNIQLAHHEWSQLYEGCREAKLKIFIIPPKNGLPDMTFVANSGLAYGDTFILSNFYHPERQNEVALYKAFFDFLYKRVVQLPPQATFEGQGDAVWLDNKTLLIGYGVRTNLAGVQIIERILKRENPAVEVIPLPMRPLNEFPPDQKVFYHLDTCLLHLPPHRTFLAYPSALQPEGLRILRQLGHVIEAEPSEAENFVCNGIVPQKNTIFLPWINDRIKTQLIGFGYNQIKIFPMMEFMKSGGAIKCLILEL